MGRSKRLQRSVEERRARIAEYLRAHPTASIRAMSRALGIPRSTLAEDLAAIRAEWAERRMEAYETRLLEDFARLDAALEAIWPQVVAGRPAAIDRLLAIIEQRRRLLGLDVLRHEHDIGDVLARYLERMQHDADNSCDAGSAPADM